MKNKKLAQRVKELRQRLGKSQEVLADDMGVSVRTIQRIENGDTQPTGDTIQRLAKALNTTPDELLDWSLQEDKGFLMALNLSALIFLVFPLIGIILPLVLWVYKRDKVKHVDTMGRKLLNFQITWTIILFLVPCIVVGIALLTKEKFTWSIPMTSYVMATVAIYLFIAIVIVLNAQRLKKNKVPKYRPQIPFLGRD